MPQQQEKSSKHLVPLLLVAAALTLTVMLQVELPLLQGLRPDWDRKVSSYRWLLHLHATLGSIALFTAPIQFFPRLRERHRRLHRMIGRVYIGAVFISAPIGIDIALKHLAGSEQFALVAQASLWVVSTLVGLVFAVAGRIDAHRQWMSCSYALTFSFVVSRFVTDVLKFHPGEAMGGNTGLIWSCTCAALLAGLPWLALPRASLAAGARSARLQA